MARVEQEKTTSVVLGSERKGPDETNPYRTLGVRKWATDSEIKMAYIRMVKRYNPEVCPDEFIVVRKAYDRLRTPDHRAKVDIMVFNEIRGGIGYKNVEKSTESLVKLNRQIREYERAGDGRPLVGEMRRQYVQLRRQRSIAYVDKNMWREALKEWDEIRQLDRADRETQKNLVVGHARVAYQLAARKRFAEALKHWETVMELAPGTVEILHNMAIVATRMSDDVREKNLWARTLHAWNEKLKKDPENAYLKAMIVETHKYFGGELLGAEKTAQEAVERKEKTGSPPSGGRQPPSPPKAFDSYSASRDLGLACMDRRNWGAAIQAFEKCLSERPDVVEIQNHLGWAHLNSGNVDSAFRVWNKALKSDPSNKETRDNLIRAHLKVAKHLEKQRVWGPSLVHLKSVLSLDPKNIEVFGRLGNIYLKRGDTLSAIEHWEKALELDPKNKEVRQAIRKAKQQIR
jgi:tetratricopeptide (TPR) repeat protein